MHNDPIMLMLICSQRIKLLKACFVGKKITKGQGDSVSVYVLIRQNACGGYWKVRIFL